MTIDVQDIPEISIVMRTLRRKRRGKRPKREQHDSATQLRGKRNCNRHSWQMNRKKGSF
jgi:hypothetical protein